MPGYLHVLGVRSAPELPKTPALVSMPYVLEPERLVYTFGGAATAGAAVARFRSLLGDGTDPQPWRKKPLVYLREAQGWCSYLI